MGWNLRLSKPLGAAITLTGGKSGEDAEVGGRDNHGRMAHTIKKVVWGMTRELRTSRHLLFPPLKSGEEAGLEDTKKRRRRSGDRYQRCVDQRLRQSREERAMLLPNCLKRVSVKNEEPEIWGGRGSESLKKDDGMERGRKQDEVRRKTRDEMH